MTDEIRKMVFTEHFNECLKNKKNAQSNDTYQYYTGSARELLSFAFVTGIITENEYSRMFEQIYPELF